MNQLTKFTLVALPLSAALYLLLYFFADRQVDLYVHSHFSTSALPHIATAISYMANSNIIKILTAATLIATLLLAGKNPPATTRKLLFICLSVCAAIIISDALKYILARNRPIMLFEHGQYGLTFFSNKWELNATPSGHTTRIFSLMTAFSCLWRKGLPLFIIIALAVGLSRIAVTAHYPSDVLFGAVTGTFTTLWLHRFFFPVIPENKPGL